MATTPRAVTFTKARQKKFLAYIETHQGCTTIEAARHVGVKRHQVKELRSTDADFDEAYKAARGYGAAKYEMEQVLLEIARDTGNASQLRAVQTYLRAHHPAYRDTTRVEVSGRDGGPVAVNALDFAKLDDEERQALKELLGRVASGGDA